VLAGLVLAAGRRRNRRRIGWLVAHVGIAVVAVGVAVSSAYTASAERRMPVGGSMTVAGVNARLATVDQHAGAAGMTAGARLELSRSGRSLGTTTPQLRYYPSRDLTVSVPAVRSRPTGDVYATVLAVTDDGSAATVRLAVNPLVGLVWLGGGMTALGGLLAGMPLPRRRRTGETAPVRPDVAVPA
jgi:cytochrome c-type biogenesis protein CcmF